MGRIHSLLFHPVNIPGAYGAVRGIIRERPALSVRSRQQFETGLGNAGIIYIRRVNIIYTIRTRA